MPRRRRRNRNNAMAISQRARRIFSRARFCFGTGGVILLGVIVCGLFPGCVRHEPPANVTIINGGEPGSLDPAIITGQVEMRVVQGLFEGLTRLDPKTARPIPGLAEGWEISADGRIYTFHLRANLVWSTGEPIKADEI